MNGVINPAPTQERAATPRTIEQLKEHVSASRLSTFLQCRLKFWFRYVLGLATPKTPALHSGSSIHQTLKVWNKWRWMNKVPTLKLLHDVFTEAWRAEQEANPVAWHEADPEEEKKNGWRLLETYFRETPIQPDEKPEGVEVTVEADLSGRGLPKLVGILDLVREGGRIVDFKTSGKTPDPEQAAHAHDLQLSAYGILYRHGTGQKESGLELHHLVKTKAPKLVITQLPPVTDVQETRLYRLMESYVNGMDREDFVPSKGFQCAGCEFFNECRNWC